MTGGGLLAIQKDSKVSPKYIHKRYQVSHKATLSSAACAELHQQRGRLLLPGEMHGGHCSAVLDPNAAPATKQPPSGRTCEHPAAHPPPAGYDPQPVPGWAWAPAPPGGASAQPPRGGGGVVEKNFSIWGAFLNSSFHSEHFEYTQVA